MTFALQHSGLTVSLAVSNDDRTACQRLRHLQFFGAEGVDNDPHDASCQHLMVHDGSGDLVATARMMALESGADLNCSFAAQHYDLKGFSGVREPLLEIGRFCVSTRMLDTDVLRVAWGAVTDYVDRRGVRYLFGCSSFQGIDPAPYGVAFATLAAKYLGPDDLRPAIKSPLAVPFASVPRQGRTPLPSLLRTYLAMGGCVGDHAVVDPVMRTMHVFTCVDVANVPPSRARSLRALAQGAALS